MRLFAHDPVARRASRVARIAERLGVRTRTQVAIAALRLELVPLNPPDPAASGES